MTTGTCIRRRFGAAGLVLTVAATLAASGQAATSQTAEAPWLKNLEARSQALNEIYGLGDAPTVDQSYLQALHARSVALNERYGAGAQPAASGTRADSFEWADAGVGAGMGVGALLLGAAAFFAVRRRGRPTRLHA
jgi:hypothetical protein